ncbi:MAG: peptidoglycan DD-metalloendopeptidase family protein [Candidatus Cloacimonetes bacterium]|nr:peptidoglycan DD-metalloendopeptidase family protein [Candidatus Cloacimonadota bacterium]
MRQYIAIFVLFFSLLSAIEKSPQYNTDSNKYHIVIKGDNLYRISLKYQIPQQKLILFNNIIDNKIFLGQKIYLTPNPNLDTRQHYVTKRPIPKCGYHIVSKGETVYRISRMYDLEILDILEINSMETYDIGLEQKIWLIDREKDDTEIAPPSDTDVHIVRSGDTLFSISQRYKMKVAELKSFNNLSTNEISVGQRLRIKPGAIARTYPEVKRPEPAISTPSPAPISKPRSKLHIPVKGIVTDEYGMGRGRLHKGIDIGAPSGTPISAALSGKVVFAGRQKGYGNVIILEHANSVMTVYAHNESNLVRAGDKVSKGQPIAAVGSTGSSSGPHLHFEYRIKGKAVNPRTVLPNL